MVIKLKNFKYPSKEEWNTIYKKFPKIGLFGFEYVDDLTSFFIEGKDFIEVRKRKELYEWDHILEKRARSLQMSFIFSITNFERGIPLKNNNFENEQKIINLILFEYYCESAFYHIHSFRDLLLQIINSAFSLEIPENKISFRKIKKKLNSDFSSILKPLEDLEIKLKQTSDIRNTIVHRFPALDPDHRPSISNDGLTYYAGTGEFVKPEDQLKIINDSILALGRFWEILRVEFVEYGLLQS